MNKFAKSLILILLVLALVFTVVACNNTAGTDNNGSGSGSGESGAVPSTDPIDKTAVFSRITTGLTLASGVVAKQDIRHVDSEYTLIVNQINLTVTFEADFNFTRKQDSQLMLKIFDNQYERNTLFIYYNKGTLYYEYDGEKSRVDGFGATSTFDVFFEYMCTVDMQSFLFTDDFSENFGLLSSFAESTNMSVRSISDTEERIEISNVNLDRMKNNVNKFIQQLFGEATFGTKLDALSNALLGFSLSDLGEIEIGLFNASEIEVILRNKAVTDFNITFSGTQSDNINTYFFDVQYSTTDVSSDIKLGRYDDPNSNEYKVSRQGERYFSGVMYVPSIDAEFKIDIYTDINASDNTTNVFLVDIKNNTDEALDPSDPHYVDNSIAYIYYINETLYVNIDGLMRYYVGNGVDLESLGFPLVKFTDMDVAQQLTTFYGYLMDYLSEGFTLEELLGSIDFNWDDVSLIPTEGDDTSLIDPESALGILLSNCSSDGDVFTVIIDDDFVGAAIGDNETDIVEWLAAQIGIDVDLFKSLMGNDTFSNVWAKLTIDFGTGEMEITVYSGEDEVFSIVLKSLTVAETGIEINEPSTFNEEEFVEMKTPEAVTLHVEGELRMQGQSEVDISAFMGAFMGDVTGVNTPYTFGIKDKFYISLDAWQSDGVTYSYLTVWDNPTYSGTLSAMTITSDPILSLSTSPASSDIFLIDYRLVGYKYQITRSGLLEAFNDLLGDNNIFTNENLMDVLRTLTGNSVILMNDDYISFTIAPYSADGVSYDPIWEILGIESMIADLKAQVKFEEPDYEIYTNDYSVVEFGTLSDLVFTSMYEANWQETVEVYFERDNATKTFKLSFIGESAKLTTGVYYYLPEAKLFGGVVSYAMVLTDTVNGTKAIDRLEESKLVIDPSVVGAIPEKIGVIYDDGTLGEQAFTIENFPYTNDNINFALTGAIAKNYKITIGAGSINEVSFTLPIEILNRVVVPVVASDGSSTDVDDAYIGAVPIVKIVTIDPYDFSLAKAKAIAEASLNGTDLDVNSYSPIGTDLTLYFRSAVSNDIIVPVNVANFEWGFDESLITYRGGSFYVYAYYNTIKVAMRIDITAKVFSYIQIVGEQPGEYTIDSLVASSYYIPVETDERAEVRVYFKTGNYRIIGTEPEGFENADPLCDGYYSYKLDWKYVIATNVTLDSVVNPLNYGKTNVDTTVFGDDIAGKQDVTITVYSPSRRVSAMSYNVQAITTIAIDAVTGDILEDETVRESVRISAVGLGAVGSSTDIDGAYFILDPYATGENLRLPSTITMSVEYADVMTRKAYAIDWVESTIIDTDGYVKNPTADENLLVATGWVGETSANRQLVTVIVHNLSGSYDNMIIIDPNTGEQIERLAGAYVMTVNPYDNYKLPTSFSLEFMEEDGSKKVLTYDTDWKINLGSGEQSLPEDFRFPYSGGEFILTTYVEAGEGILAQQVNLTIAVLEKEIIGGIIYGLSSEMTPANDSLAYFTVDPYKAESQTLVEQLMSVGTVGVSFMDGTRMADGLPVTWDNLSEALSVLQSEGGTVGYPNELFTLTGKVHRFSEALEQEVSVSFRVLEKRILSIAFTRLDDNTVSNGVVSLDVDLENAIIKINLLKPYILVTNLTDQASPSEYIDYLFSSIRIAFEDDTYDTFALEDATPDDLDRLAFTFASGSASSFVTFPVDRLSAGSRTENFTVTVQTVRDELLSDSLYESVETFQTDGGTPLYSSGYDLSSSLEVEFKYSGKVTYAGLIWYAKSNYTATDGGDILLAINEPVPNQNIPSSLFKTMTGNTIWLYTKLPNGKEVNKSFYFYKKNIKETKYNGTAENSYYSITGGQIILNNIYTVYPFNASLLPKTVVPLTGSENTEYQIENVVYFGVTWLPTADFASDADPTKFDQNKINNLFNYKGYGGGADEVFATAEIQMYNGETQTIYLYIIVAELSDGEIRHEDLTVESAVGTTPEGTSAMLNSVVLDPYEDNFGGEFVLPHDITAIFGTQTYQFALTADIKYYIRNTSGEYVLQASVPYTHLGHALGSSYGDPTDTLFMRVVLPDGQVLYMDVTFNSRELVDILVPNKATLIEGGTANLQAVYYIDPYDTDTYQVPMSAEFVFTVGDNSLLNISYWTISESNAPFTSSFRFVKNSTSYEGAVYHFESSLSGYGVLAQTFSITVIVLDRSLEVRPTSGANVNSYPYVNVFSIANPIATLASDVPSTLTQDSFVALDDAIYNAYNAISVPVLPSIVWNIKNDDLVYTGMANVKFSGKVTYGGVAGEAASITINAPRWDFARINESATDGISSNFVDFNTYTTESVSKEVSVVFYVNNTATTVETVFYPYEHADTDAKLRTVINWGAHDVNVQALKTFTLGNSSKSLIITVANRYAYRYTQVPVTQIDFGYGYAASNYVELVIDPLNPVVPSEVLARGKEPDAAASDPFIELGSVPITWGSSIYDMPYEGLETARLVEATLTTTNGVNVMFNVKVYYLNRTPITIKTSSEGYSASLVVGGLYTLSSKNSSTGIKTSYFQIDPTALATYNASTNSYILPSDLIFEFKSVYANSTMTAAASLLGSTFTYSDIVWKLSRPITLTGTDTENDAGVVTESNPIIATITSGVLTYVKNSGTDDAQTVDCGKQVYSDGMNEEYELELKVINREVEYTSVSTKVEATDGTSYQKALSEYYIDPYEEGYLSSFPDTIIVKYTGAQEQTITIEEWIFDEDYLQRPDVISGLILENGGTPESMTVMAEIRVYGTTIAIQFPIKARNIVTTIAGGEGTVPLNGGTIYVLKGYELRPQLPEYMYYKFEYDGELDVTAVPLVFSENNLFGVSTKNAGVSYTVLGTLGGINVDNIEFTVTVIDPEVFTTINDGELIKKGCFHFDYVEIARSTAGFYTVGKERDLLPQRIMINDLGDYLSVESIEYTLTFDENGNDTGYATFHCKYIFNVGASLNLSGNEIGDGDGSDQLAISFTLPIKSYDYTMVDATLPLTFDTTEYVVELGSIIHASDMPTAVNTLGEEYNLMWDMSGVDTNRADTYTAYGYYLNNSARNNVVVLSIIVKQQEIEQSDINISSDWTERIYSGETVDIDDYLTISTFLRDDGTYDRVEGYTVKYSVDGGIIWQTTQPLRVGDYLVKITVNDYNIFGEKTIAFVINKAVIPEGSITFHESIDSAAVAEGTDAIVLHYYYSGETVKPVIKGLLDDPNLEYVIVYEKRGAFNSETGTYAYSVETPVNAGIYRVTVTFPDQRDYYSANSYSVVYNIIEKDVTYSIQREMVYNGRERDVIVNGLPQNPTVAGVTVTYTYYDPSDLSTPLVGKVKNVGTYMVTVVIDGGVNYPSANCNGVSAPNLVMFEFKILPKEVIIYINELETEYLEDILPLYSAVTIMDADDPTKSGLQGADTIALFLAVLKIYCSDVADGVLTYRHMVNDRSADGTGGYNLVASLISAGDMPSNYTVSVDTGYVNGKYYITATNGAKVISNKLELDNAIAQLRDNQEVKWYLRNGSYGTITINKNATVSIVGSYNLVSGKVAVDFTAINVLNGGVTVDIVNFKAYSKSASVTIGENASSVTINRSAFIRSGSAYLTGSIGVVSAPGFDGVLTMTNSSVYGYATAVYLRGGSLSMSNTIIDSNIIGVQVQNGSMILLNNIFRYNRGEGVYNTSREGDISISGNSFIGNAIAVKSYQALMNDIVVQNSFTYNSIDTYQLY